MGVTTLIGQLCSRTGFKIPLTPPPVAPILVLAYNWLIFLGAGLTRGLVQLKGWERPRAPSLGWSLQTAGSAVPRTILLYSAMACVSVGTPTQGPAWCEGRQLGRVGADEGLGSRPYGVALSKCLLFSGLQWPCL